MDISRFLPLQIIAMNCNTKHNNNIQQHQNNNNNNNNTIVLELSTNYFEDFVRAFALANGFSKLCHEQMKVLTELTDKNKQKLEIIHGLINMIQTRFPDLVTEQNQYLFFS